MARTGKTAFPGADKFPITPEMRAWAEEKVPTLDIEYYHDEFCDHWGSNGKQMKDWVLTWRNWMRRTDRGAAPGLYGPDDRRIVRKRPKPVPQQPDMNVSTPQSRAWDKLDRLRAQAIAAGLGTQEARLMDPSELIDFLNGKEQQYGRK